MQDNDGETALHRAAKNGHGSWAGRATVFSDGNESQLSAEKGPSR